MSRNPFATSVTHVAQRIVPDKREEAAVSLNVEEIKEHFTAGAKVLRCPATKFKAGPHNED